MIFSTWLRNWKRSLDRRWALHQALRRKSGALRSASRPRLEALEDRTLLSTTAAYVVTSAADSNAAGTLLYAINQVNAGNYNEIDFNIGSVGSAQTINLGTQLPTLTASNVYINGLSQGGKGNTTPLITLNGAGAPIHIDGLLVQGSNCTISGLTVSNFGANGIEIEGSNNLIGGSAAGAANIITGNVGDGVKIDSGVSGNQVVGDYIGTNAAGNAGLGNGNGVEVVSANNTVGGLTATAGNVISGNNNDGILIDHRASGVAVLGNYIGTNYAGNAALGNSIGIEVFGVNNTIGGTNPAAFNLISGSHADGVLIDSIGSGNQVLGNYIVTNADGTGSLANNVGIEVVGIGNIIGGTVSGAGNLISGNSKDGVLIDSTSSGSQVLGNYIGTNFAGTAALGNGNGIEVAGISNMIGGTSAAARNIISGNGNDGVLLDSAANGNQVLGNYIGTNANGLGRVANSGNGIEVAGSSNTVGGTVPGAGNIISGISGDGVKIDSGGNSNQVLGSFVGTNPTNSELANSIGIEVAGNNNTIGGTEAFTENSISGNRGDGVKIDSSASGTQVLGNFIGTNYDGSAPLANSGNGIEIAGNDSTVGGTFDYAGNIISGNSGDGVKIDSGAGGNQVLGNTIGANNGGGAPLANSGNGITVAGNNNMIGRGNIISGNSGDGVKIASGVSGIQVVGNYIGVNNFGNAAVGNSGNGIEIAGSNNKVGGGNVISGNSKDGVLIASGASGNQVMGSQIGANGSGIGVEVGGNSNTVGGTASGARNIISGNSGTGLVVAGGDLVLGNYIGTNAAGNAALPNSVGIVMGSANTIGGTASGAGNLISGNSSDGVQIVSGGANNHLLGNYIGTDSTGSKPLANSIGVELDGAFNTVGGTASGASNLISGDSYAGMVISGSANQVLGNLIGAALGGNAALADGTGIYVNNGSGNTIGGTTSGAGNLISGNSTDGMLIVSSFIPGTGFGGTDNQVVGNSIGTNAAGTAAVANLHSGIYLQSGFDNTIGGTASGAGNLISGNTSEGCGWTAAPAAISCWATPSAPIRPAPAAWPTAATASSLPAPSTPWAAPPPERAI